MLDRIAVGGMAEVFKAKTFGVHGFERLLVIKRILPQLSEDQEFIEMFIDEAKIAVELTHANICQVSDLGKIADNYFIAMEFINGKDMRAILKKCFVSNQTLSIPQTLHIVLEILKGLQYAHNRVDSLTEQPLNLIHRDISPQNIMVSYYGEVKIVDFGIAKTESKIHRTQVGVLKGKFGYMSPEQASGLEIDQRTDIFSTGILLYEMLTNRRLFHSDTDFKTLEAIKECKIPSPKKYNTQISDELEAIVLKALTKERDERYKTAQEMQTDLSRLFYTHHSNFTVKHLSDFMHTLFKTEIVEEQEALKRAVDAIPQEKISAALSAHHLEQSQTFSQTLGQAAPSSKTQSQVTLAPAASKTQSPSLIQKILTPKVLVPLLLSLAFFYYFFDSPNAVKKEKVALSNAQTLEIVSTPLGATVLVEGEPRGVTPLNLQLLSGKVYAFELRLDGHQPLSDQVLIKPSQDRLSFTLEKKSPKLASIFVDSAPQGASILLNGEPTHLKTPATLHKLPFGKDVQITFELEGYKPDQQTVQVEKDLQEVFATLGALSATVKINIVPQEATVFLDHEKVTSPIGNLAQGKTYAFTFEAPGYETTTRKITPNNPLVEIDIELSKKELPRGTINLSAVPWATVKIDGIEMGSTPLINLPVPIGKHKITFHHQDYGDVVKTVDIKKGENPSIIVDLTKQR